MLSFSHLFFGFKGRKSCGEFYDTTFNVKLRKDNFMA